MADGVRTRLILAGLAELEEHGIKDFSLRRAAVRAQVSCAAPYRHFKDKDEFILETVRYIESSWALLCREIEAAFFSDTRRLLMELCMANLRFWLANSSFRSVLMLSPKEAAFGGELMKIDKSLISAIERYSQECGNSSANETVFAVRSLIYGTVLLVGTGEIANDAATQALVRSRLEKLLSA